MSESDPESDPTVDDRELMRLLHGELAPERARELTARLDRDPELALGYRRLAAAWEALEPPPPSPPPPGFTGRVMARVRERAAGREVGWSGAPGWVRAAGAAALAAGVLAGAGLGAGRSPAPGGGTAVWRAAAPAASGAVAVSEPPEPPEPPGPAAAIASTAAGRPAAGGTAAASEESTAGGTAAGGTAAASEESTAGGTAAGEMVAATATTAAGALADDLAAELPAGLAPDSSLTGGYWAAIGLADDLFAGDAEEPWS
jgi:hypothetical protein